MNLIPFVLLASTAAVPNNTPTVAASTYPSGESSPSPKNPVVVSTPIPTPARTLVSTDFGFPGVRSRNQSSKSASGPLAFPWRDTSEWGKLWVTYAFKNEGGRRFQRVYVSRLAEGRAQLIHPFPSFFSPSRRALTLDMEVKGTPGLSIFFGIRQQGAPYDYAWANAIVLTQTWCSVQWRIPPVQLNQALMFIFEVPRDGTFDIRRCKLAEVSE